MASCLCPEGTLKSADPRRVGICARCGKTTATPRLTPERIATFFDYMENMLRAAGEIHPDQPEPVWDYLRAHAVSRLLKGEKEYGANNFLRASVDLQQEASQELADLANYALMADEKHADEDGFADLTGVVYHAYLAQKCLLRYYSRLRGAAY